MAEQIGTEATKALVEAGPQLVEVLPVEAYRKEHLPGAVSIPPDQDGCFGFYADEVLPAVVPPSGTGAIPSLR